MVLNFEEIKEKDIVGNKAKFLALMKRDGFNIPNGFVLDVNAYIEIISENKIKSKIEEQLTCLNENNIDEISKKISILFDTVKINESLLKEINTRLQVDKKYAVRSSGTKEDLENYSFAGQYTTSLNVEIKDIPQAIIECYKSMFSENILSYFLNNNISFENLAMTVIIQEMVDSEYSGICFTINPITGNDKEMLIEVGEGLGENIVSGKVAPEQYHYNWYNQEVMNNSNKFLSDDFVCKIGEIFSDIALYFGYPCDIEFAIQNEELYILQARKITKIQYQGYEDVWSTADFKDGGVSATICTPYMWSLYEYIWEYTLRKYIVDSKILNPKQVEKKLGDMFYARCYWNMSVVKHAMSQVVGYKEREFDSEYGIKMNYEGDGQTTRVSIKSISDIIRMAIAQRKILKTRNKNAEKYKKELLDKYFEYKKQYDNNQISDIKQVWYELTHDIYLQSESTYFWQIFINTVHQSLYKGSLLKYVSESDYLTLLGSIENISHLLPFYDMWSISRAIRKDDKKLGYWQKTSIEELVYNYSDKNKKKKDNIDERIFELIEEYGYHSDKELDVTYKCYYEDITPLISSLKDMTCLKDKFSPYEDKKQGKEKYNAILNSIKNESGEKKYKKVKNKIDNMRKMLWWREEFRDISTRFYYLIRVYTLRLAEKLLEEDVIESVDDIWFLKVSDLWEYLDNRLDVDALNQLITRNKKYYNSYRNYISENEIGSNLKAENTTENLENQIKGLGANNGVIIGTARVIESFSEIDKLQKGDILVTKFTDTGWTSKFAILSGIVTEYGGILCHAAIVSREYGIPAIVSCRDVMQKIKDGEKIKIDGTTGIVEKIEEK